MQEKPFQAVTILRARAKVDLPELAIKRGEIFYLARDGQSQSFHAVKWDRVRWICSCGKGACEHKLSTNTFVFEQSQRRQLPSIDQAARSKNNDQRNG